MNRKRNIKQEYQRHRYDENNLLRPKPVGPYSARDDQQRADPRDAPDERMQSTVDISPAGIVPVGAADATLCHGFLACHTPVVIDGTTRQNDYGMRLRPGYASNVAPLARRNGWPTCLTDT